MPNGAGYHDYEDVGALMNDQRLQTLEGLKKYCEEVMGQWNGDEAGIQEDNVRCAEEILEAIELIENNLKEIV